MPFVRWSQRFSVGVQVFDAEHMQLLSLINEFLDCVATGLNRHSVERVLNGLIAFSGRHFAHEEEFFGTCGYAGADAHKAEHARLTAEIVAFRDALNLESIDKVAIDLNGFLVAWFMEHTEGMDREFCTELNKLGIR